MSSISSAGDQARDNLRKIEHFVVLMLENRSFDQMLGYLQLEGHDVDGLKPETNKPPLVNWYSGKSYEPQVPERTALTKAEDPCHDAWCVAEQLSKRHGERNGGFVENFAATHPAADPSAVMEYYTAEQVPVYDHLAEQFCVCDRWFFARCRALPGRTGSTQSRAARPAASTTNCPRSTAVSRSSANWTRLRT